MSYQYEYFYIYKEKLLLSETIENMEELLELVAIEQIRANPEKMANSLFSGSAQRATSSIR
ncbi:hypothetical protein [Oceanispirochaeta sp.]|jgi:hypothetical protein|uniref:hypothetical protein n=1 Tax=Oceanispirochaeta sp. TaxID=2035350 RepID=UPI00260A584E|nr:hypothetical protein [Oceanispirochaeta sp.]MDA3958779.1 hypothetical protein [Oceanispirochaeta sp.]